jgi:tRNA-2-methylthio-N6-dimethylallyladenosine synthase
MERLVHIETFGCQMNEVDSSRMVALLAGAGYAAAPSREEADLVVLNTCSIREKAAHKVYSELGVLSRWKRRRRGRILAVGGCLAQQEGEAIRERAPHVDVVFGTHNIASLPDLVLAASARKRSVRVAMDGDTRHWDVLPYLPEGAGSAMVTIMQGCDNHCAYCIVPKVRGPEISRPADDVLREAERLAGRGVSEVILLGQNVNSYGKKSGEIPFHRLVRRVAAVEGIRRVRFITSHPRDLTDETVALFAEVEEVCPHLHLPLQSGSDRVLAAMGRGYTRGEYLAKVEALRKARPGMTFSSDFIVAFPGERTEDFHETLSVMEEVRYDSVFSFRYSPRPGTRGAALPVTVPDGEASERLSGLQRLQERHTRERLGEAVGTEAEVLVERAASRGDGRLFGRDGHYRGVNFLPRGAGEGTGSYRKVRILSAGVHTLSGEEVP